MADSSLSRLNTPASCSFACQRRWQRWQLCSVKYSSLYQPSQVKHADIETVKGEGEEGGKGGGGGGEGPHPLLKCQDVINSYKVNMEDFNLCLCQDKDFLRLPLALSSRPLSLPLFTHSRLSALLCPAFVP